MLVTRAHIGMLGVRGSGHRKAFTQSRKKDNEWGRAVCHQYHHSLSVSSPVVHAPRASSFHGRPAQPFKNVCTFGPPARQVVQLFCCATTQTREIIGRRPRQWRRLGGRRAAEDEVLARRLRGQLAGVMFFDANVAKDVSCSSRVWRRPCYTPE